MLSTVLLVVVGIIIGWQLPQPEWAKPVVNVVMKPVFWAIDKVKGVIGK